MGGILSLLTNQSARSRRADPGFGAHIRGSFAGSWESSDSLLSCRVFGLKPPIKSHSIRGRGRGL